MYVCVRVGSSVGEWLRQTLAVLGVDGSSLLTASHQHKDVIIWTLPMPNC